MSNPQLNDYLQRELIRRELVGRDLLEFTRMCEKNYQPGWVHEDICRRLERFSREVAERKSPRLMLLVPPRHGKSTLASQMLPAWHLGKHPDHEIMNVGYNLELPTKFSRRVRELLQLKEYQAVFPETSLDPRSQSVEAWLTTRRGGFKAAGVGGGLTGMGAHVMIIDDPIKNMEEADNFEHREKLEDWYFSVAYSRLAPGGGVLFIETMWHDDDLAGRLLAKMESHDDSDQWDVIRYPAISNHYEYRKNDSLEIFTSDKALPEKELENTTLLRPPGEALHPERYSTDYLLKVAHNSPDRVWSALYQQNPVPESGLFFTVEDFHTLPVLPEKSYSRFYIAWDFAISEKQHADYTVGVCLQQNEDGDLFVVDLVRFRGGAARICEEFVSMVKRWRGFLNSSTVIGVEDGQIWKALKPVLMSALREENLMVPVDTLTALSDKKVRANPLQSVMQHRRLFFYEKAGYLRDVKREFLRFPAGKHDDMVDAMSWAVRLSENRAPVKRPKKKPLKSWKDKLNLVARSSSGTHMSA